MTGAEEPEEREGSGCAGAAVITAAVLALAAILCAVAPKVMVLGLWALGFGFLIWTLNRVPRAPNPAPPPVPERGSDEEPQVIILRDKSHPNRWLTLRPSKWLDWTDEDRDES